MKALQDRQKSYANNQKSSLKFQMGNKVFLKVAPWKNIIQFRMKGKLAPRYIEPFKITKIIGLVTYSLALSPYLSKIHDVFNLSLLWKTKVDPSRVLLLVPIKVKEDLTLEVKLMQILDLSEKELRNKKVPIIKVLWRNLQMEEQTWERQSGINLNFRDETSY